MSLFNIQYLHRKKDNYFGGCSTIPYILPYYAEKEFPRWAG